MRKTRVLALVVGYCVLLAAGLIGAIGTPTSTMADGGGGDPPPPFKNPLDTIKPSYPGATFGADMAAHETLDNGLIEVQIG